MVQDTDRYGRTVGRVYVGAMDVNAEMVKRGAAWVYRQFLKDHRCSLWKRKPRPPSGACGRCRKRSAARLGLAEGDLRHRLGPGYSTTDLTPATSSGGFTCAGKRYCREMTRVRRRSFT